LKNTKIRKHSETGTKELGLIWVHEIGSTVSIMGVSSCTPTFFEISKLSFHSFG